MGQVIRPQSRGPDHTDSGLLSMVEHQENTTNVNQRKTPGYGGTNTVVGIDNTHQDALAELIASLSNGSEKSDSSDTNTSSAWNAQVTFSSLTKNISFHFNCFISLFENLCKFFMIKQTKLSCSMVILIIKMIRPSCSSATMVSEFNILNI